MIIQYQHGDPGGTAALLPVIYRLQNEGHELIQHDKLSEQADFLITSTSDGTYSEAKSLTLQARKAGIPSLSVLDYWSHYRKRYANANDILVYLPDKIAVMDDYARQEMVLLGFPPDVLEVTGQPAFDCLEKRRQRYQRSFEWPYSMKYVSRRGHGFIEDEPLVIFLSQPIATSGYGWGFNEYTVIPKFLDAMAEVAPDCQILIRPHPRENNHKLYEFEAYKHLDVKIRRSPGIKDLMMGADLIVGMNTVMLVEACYLGCITLSIQPGKIGPDRLPTNRLGFSYAVYDDSLIKSAVDELLNNDQKRDRIRHNLERFKVKESATDKVVELVKEMAKDG